mmetsp:Transcript_74653/g.218707  ORF Transcript_74653/g.218707 Transcript_74653/m.218707 type:complete len:264 (-) Transcript_74653:573-1364(-)
MRLRVLEDATHLLRALLERLLGHLGVPDGRTGPGGCPSQELVAEEDGGGRQVRRIVLHHLVVDQRELQKVVRQVAVRIGAAVHDLVPLEEVHRCRQADLEVERREHRDLHLDDLVLAVRLVRDVDEVVDLRRILLLKLGSDEEGGDADKLKVPPRGGSLLQVAVDDADAQEEGQGAQLVLLVDVNKPVNEDGAHLRVDVRLLVHVTRLRQTVRLHLLHIPIDVGDVLHHMLRVLRVGDVRFDEARGLRRRGCGRRHLRRGRRQ